jgi:hypothetical protein
MGEDFPRQTLCTTGGSKEQEKPDNLGLGIDDSDVEAGVMVVDGVLVKDYFRGAESTAFVFLARFGVGVGTGGFEEIDDGWDVALLAELEEGAGAALLGVGFEVDFFGEEGEDVEVGLEAAFVVEGAEDLRGAGGRGGADVCVAGGAFHDFVGVEEALPGGPAQLLCKEVIWSYLWME